MIECGSPPLSQKRFILEKELGNLLHVLFKTYGNILLVSPRRLKQPPQLTWGFLKCPTKDAVTGHVFSASVVS